MARGAAVLTDTSGTRRTFAGTQTKLYELASGTWADVSRVGDYTGSDENRWSFAQFGFQALMVTDTAVYRYVMLDESVYVSWYHSAQSAHMEMPETYRFGKDSFIYSTLRMDLMRKFEISAHKVVFDAADDDGVLIDHLARLTGRPCPHWSLV